MYMIRNGGNKTVLLVNASCGTVLTAMLSNEVKLNLNRFLQLLTQKTIITLLIHFHRISMLVFYQFTIGIYDVYN